MTPSTPASRRDAIDLIKTFHPTPDTPGQRLLFGRASLDRLFDNGQRAPERVWAVPDGDGRGLVAGRQIGDLALVDMLSLPDDDASADRLIAAATSWARSADEAEASFEAPFATDPLTRPETARIVAALGRAGWRVLVTRSHFHLDAVEVDGASGAVPLDVDLVQADTGDTDRLARLLTRVLPGSLDARDQLSVAEHGTEEAARRLADELVESDPPECLRFAVRDGEDVGVVSWRLMPDRRAFVLFVGVAVEHRGRGLGGELVAAATRDLVADGAQTLIADTDDANLGMLRGFARAGWHPTQSRIDLVLRHDL